MAFLSEHDLSENRFPPRIKSGAGFFGIMLQCVDRSLSLRLLRAICCVANASCLAETAMPVVANRQIADTHFEAGNGRCEALTAQSTVRQRVGSLVAKMHGACPSMPPARQDELCA